MIQTPTLSWEVRGGIKSFNPSNHLVGSPGSQPPSLGAFQKSPHQPKRKHLCCSHHLGNSKSFRKSVPGTGECCCPGLGSIYLDCWGTLLWKFLESGADRIGSVGLLLQEVPTGAGTFISREGGAPTKITAEALLHHTVQPWSIA